MAIYGGRPFLMSDSIEANSSIRFLYLLNPTQGCGGAGAYPSCHWARGRVHPGQVAGPHRDKRDKQPSTLTFTVTLRVNIESSTNLTCMFLGDGRKPAYPERTHANMRKTCTLHTERSHSEYDLTQSYVISSMQS